MRKRTVSVFGTALALLAAPAAADESSFNPTGLYLGVGALFTQNSLVEDQVSQALPVDIHVDDSWGINGLLGYRFLPFLSTEIEYEHVGAFSVETAGSEVGAFQADVLTANLKASVPLWRLQPYLRVGAGVAWWDVKDELSLGLSGSTNGFAGRAGAGVDFFLTPRLVLNAGADVVVSDTPIHIDVPGTGDIDYLAYASVGAGLQYRFWSTAGH